MFCLNSIKSTGLIFGDIRGCIRALEILLRKKRPDNNELLKDQVIRGYQILDLLEDIKPISDHFWSYKWYKMCKSDSIVLRTMLQTASREMRSSTYICYGGFQ